MKIKNIVFCVFCLFGLTSITLNALLKTKSKLSVSKRSAKTLSRPLIRIAAATSPPVSSSPGSTINSRATVSGTTLSDLNLGAVGALSNVSSKTTGNTGISLDGAAFVPGATIAVGSNNDVQGAQQVIGNVLGGSNTATVSGYSGATLGAVPSFNGGTSSGVSNVSNQTTGDFAFHMNGGAGGGVGSLTLQNGSAVVGGLTTTGIVGGTTHYSQLSPD